MGPGARDLGGAGRIQFPRVKVATAVSFLSPLLATTVTV
jgi:hypothetical protein